MKNILLFLFLPLFLGACGDDDNTPNGPDENDNINWYAAADSSTTALVNSFWNAEENILIMIATEYDVPLLASGACAGCFDGCLFAYGRCKI